VRENQYPKKVADKVSDFRLGERFSPHRTPHNQPVSLAISEIK
jgi:hypothetical protein